MNDPLTGQPFPNRIIPKNRLDPIALKLMNLIPEPNSANGQFLGSFPEPVNNRQYMLKGDYHISSGTRLAVSYFRDRTMSSSVLDFGRVRLPFVNYTGDPAKYSDVGSRSLIGSLTTILRPPFSTSSAWGSWTPPGNPAARTVVLHCAVGQQDPRATLPGHSHGADVGPLHAQLRQQRCRLWE